MIMTITIPPEFYDKACAIMRAIDPDVGGCLSFGEFDPEKTSYTVDMPCSESCFELSNNPDLFHDFIKSDYEKRWAEMTVPTLDDVTTFCGYIEHTQLGNE